MRLVFLSALAASLLAGTAAIAQTAPVFNRIATFPVVSNLPAGADPAKKTVAEIVAASADGRTLAYANAERKAVGFIDIADPAAPKGAGEVELGGEVTSVAVAGGKALAAVSTGESKKAPAGQLATIDLASKRVEARCNLGGQPDSVAKSPDGRFLAVVIENERDESLDKGRIPQLPGGDLKVFSLADGVPDCASMRSVALTGLAAVAPEDPEPEFVDVNAAGEAVVTLQENNHIAIVNLADGKVTAHFPAGAVTVEGVDAKRDGVVNPVDRAENVAREPDAVKWLGNDRFVVANEGDYQGGSRGFTIFGRDGKVEFDSGNALEHLAVALGHYPERRSNSKGTEPEGVEVARFGDATYIFVATERANLVAVYRDRGPGQAPEFVQALPAGQGPEGLVAIPSRDLLVVANEVDDSETGLRSTVMIYRREAGAPAYPTIEAGKGANGSAIAWGALSGLSVDPANPNRLYAVTDSFYAQGKILTIDVAAKPARIVAETVVAKDGKPAANLDLEGIVARPGGGFWLASEGNPERKEGPTDSLLLRVGADGAIAEEIGLPDAVKAGASRFGYEGVTATGEGADETVWLAVQREWKDDPKGAVKLAAYKPATKSWGFVRYPLESAGAGWIGLSDITAAGPDRLLIVERDNQMGEAAKVKRLYAVSLAGVTPAAPGQAVPTIRKTLVKDLVADLRAPKGYVLDKVEGFAVAGNGEAYAVTDNDGVDGSSGETQFLRLGKLTPMN